MLFAKEVELECRCFKGEMRNGGARKVKWGVRWEGGGGEDEER